MGPARGLRAHRVGAARHERSDRSDRDEDDGGAAATTGLLLAISGAVILLAGVAAFGALSLHASCAANNCDNNKWLGLYALEAIPAGIIMTTIGWGFFAHNRSTFRVGDHQGARGPRRTRLGAPPPPRDRPRPAGRRAPAHALILTGVGSARTFGAPRLSGQRRLDGMAGAAIVADPRDEGRGAWRTRGVGEERLSLRSVCAERVAQRVGEHLDKMPRNPGEKR
jgi:hypothetical protein